MRHRRVAVAGLLLSALLALVGAPASDSSVQSPSWWMVDTHEHSAFSGDARADLGLDAAAAKSLGYNAVFLTDHDRGSSFQIQGANGNYLSYQDTLSGRWTAKTTGKPSSSTNAVGTSQVHSGTSSLHLATTASAASSTFDYAIRGTGLRSGDVMLDFWMYPQAITGAAGADISVAIGGDKTVEHTFGYTTTDGTTHVGKSTVLVWQLGNARAGSADGTTDVYTSSLPYSAGAWNHYVIDVMTGAATQTVGTTTQTFATTGLNALPTSDRPVDYAVLSDVKMEAATTASGAADVYVDDFALETTSPQCPAAEFTYRNSLIDSGQFNGTNAKGGPFAIYPAREMGQGYHSNQFVFDITSPSQYYDTYVDKTVPAAYGNDATLCAATNTASAPWKFSYQGTDNIPAVQASGYPAKDNHPGTTDSTTDVTNTNAHNADLVEVRTGSDFSPTWVSILQKNHIVIGTYGSDAHTGTKSGEAADFIYAPTNSVDDLLKALFEGRTFMAPNTFSGRIAFNLDGSAAPYPARYPVYVSPSQASTSAHLLITGGLASGQTVKWFYGSGSGETTLASDTVTGSTYEQTKTIPMSGAFTYVRAAVYSGSSLLANTQPIFFEDVSSLPADKSVRVDSYSVSTGCSCSVAVMKGITAATWSGSTVNLSLTAPSGGVVQLAGTSASAPTGVTMDGATVSPAASYSDFAGSSGDAWYYDSAADNLYLRDAVSGTSSAISVLYGSAPDDSAPTVPGTVQASASGSTVAVSWTGSTDADSTPVAGYNVYRDSILVGSTNASTLGYSDPNVSAGSHTYTVSAFDTGNNESAQSAPAAVTVSGGNPPPVFSDDFESGTLANWTSSAGIVVQSAIVDSGNRAARATTSGGAGAYAVAKLPQTYGELYYRIRFYVVAHDANTLYLLRMRAGTTGSALFGVYLKGTGGVCYRNESPNAVVGATTTCSSSVPAVGTWHTLLAHLQVNGGASLAEVWLDGTKIISKTEDFGTTQIGQLHLGDNGTGKTDDVVYDNVVADSSPLTP